MSFPKLTMTHERLLAHALGDLLGFVHTHIDDPAALSTEVSAVIDRVSDQLPPDLHHVLSRAMNARTHPYPQTVKGESVCTT